MVRASEEAPSRAGLEELVLKVYGTLALMVMTTIPLVGLVMGTAQQPEGRRRATVSLLQSLGLSKRLQLRPVDPAQPLPEEAVCRICQEGPEAAEAQGQEGSNFKGALGRFCGCKGSLAFAHPNCLEQWRSLRGEDCCELCKQSYSLEVSLQEALPRRSLTKVKERVWGALKMVATSRTASYVLTVALVWSWLWHTGGCDGDLMESWRQALMSCTAEPTVGGWTRSIAGASAIGCFVRLLMVLVAMPLLAPVPLRQVADRVPWALFALLGFVVVGGVAAACVLVLVSVASSSTDQVLWPMLVSFFVLLCAVTAISGLVCIASLAASEAGVAAFMAGSAAAVASLTAATLAAFFSATMAL